MDMKVPDKTLRNIVVLGSTVLLGYCTYAAYKYWRKRQFKSIDEGFEDVSKLEESPVKRILVLGLEGAGKSTIISQISSGTTAASQSMNPTDGFYVTLMENVGNMSLNIWEIGGRGNVRSFWPNFLQDTDVLVFVVDASDAHNLSLAIKEVRWLLSDYRLAKVPVLFIAHKQDKQNAMTPMQVSDALDLKSIPSSDHKIRVVGTQAPPNAAAVHPSISEVEQLLQLMIND